MTPSEQNVASADELFPLVYGELRRLAAERMAHERPDHSLDATALVHEAYLRLQSGQKFQNRAHFFAAAAEAMRRILVDHARRRHTLKRGGAANRAASVAPPPESNAPYQPDELLEIHEALTRFEALHPLKSQVVMLRFFAGLSGDQIADTLGISSSTVDNYWAYARAWLRAEIDGTPKKI